MQIGPGAGCATPRVGGVAVFALMLAGLRATPTTPWGVDFGDYQAAPRDLIAVTSDTADYMVRLDHSGAISKVERNKLAAFLAEGAFNRPESLRITVHGRVEPGAGAGNHECARHRRGQPGTHYYGRGMGIPAPAVPRGTVVLAIERAVAIAPSCPGYIGPSPRPLRTISTEPNLGCANAYNFAAMVSDPHHLSRGASSIYYSGQRGASDVAAYRADKVKPLPRLQTKASPLGQSVAVAEAARLGSTTCSVQRLG